MRNALTIILLSLLLQVSLQAQVTTFRRSWIVGMAAGPLFNQVQQTTPGYNYTGGNGYQLGAVAEYRLSPGLSLRGELNLEQRSFGTSYYSQGVREIDTSSYICWDCYYDMSLSYVSQYLSVPVYLQFTQSSGKLGVNFRVGAFYSLLMSASRQGHEELYLDAEGTKNFSFEFIDFDGPGLYRDNYSGAVYDVINTYDAGFSFGLAGWYALNKKTSLQLDFFVKVGLANVFENPTMPEVTQRSYSIRLGVQRQLGE
ncbi:MAG: PorT family protein [Bacteroidetes bacterium]|nr:PorT family protein [Bacteroidota bacterium]